MSSPSSQLVRIGESRGRIVRVSSEAVEFVDESGVDHAIDLASRCLAPPRRAVGLRGGNGHLVVFEFFGPNAVRMEFESDMALYQQLLVPLARAGYGSLDGD